MFVNIRVSVANEAGDKNARPLARFSRVVNGATAPNYTNWRKRDPLKHKLHLYRLEEETHGQQCKFFSYAFPDVMDKLYKTKSPNQSFEELP
ncbi:hypothetical protein H671_8g19199 [Cricetulus griseus]|nr:hypothetical protein H671_8g19199 [Cricetulus griseus]